MKIHAFSVLPNPPEKLRPLHQLAYNLYFSWHPEVVRLFKRLCPISWESANCNPVRLFCLVPQDRMDAMTQDTNFLSEMNKVYQTYQQYLTSTGWYHQHLTKTRLIDQIPFSIDYSRPLFAYFCAEFGLHECLPVYSGGLGILAGEHIKSTSDLGIPVVGVGLLYRHGYFRQYLNREGIQQELSPENDWYSMPVQLERDEYGNPIRGQVEMGNEVVWFQIWRVDVGRNRIYLLDTNLDDNPPHLRAITNMLYDQDRKRRIQQEILLGIGGIRALDLVGCSPLCYHINEGHSAFLLLERIRKFIYEHRLSFEEAREIVWLTTLFTTHTPVPAGHERFPPHLIEMFLSPYVTQLGLDWERFMAFGRENPYDREEHFCLTVFALRFCAYANGVSKLHEEISRSMWKNIYTNIPVSEIPISHVTNGIHAESWLNPHIHEIFPNINEPITPSYLFQNIDVVPNELLWKFRCQAREKLITYAREQIRWQLSRQNIRTREFGDVNEILDPNVLTIGFARRMTGYKRAYLLFQNPERLAKILNHPEHPVQIILAGKAHPADYEAKEIIKKIFELCQQPEFKKKVVFLEDYDIAMARHLVQGCDVWLNTPRRPLEASGTSGMKVVINGGLHCSTLDGWWDEAYSPDYGWAIGQGEQYNDPETQDHIESDILYGILERDIVPTFYNRDSHGIPQEWIMMIKRSIRTLGPQFTSNRMIKDYCTKFYDKMLLNAIRFSANDYQKTKELAQWRQKLRRVWNQIQIVDVDYPKNDFHYKGHIIEVSASIRLQDLHPQDISVECCHGILNSNREFIHINHDPMHFVQQQGDLNIYRTRIAITRTGYYGITVRILPGHPDLPTKFIPGFLKWYE